ncbi:hypothetical protein Cfor_00790 [Coptotermes formosanus]|uniref:Uncharacterized protein n=1 Tax=Coptotermes formosanus TaxID=36987 RepID=A0A6L2PEG8_COPFO|nr:hypothetical protein Cfor_00790 [Coptotermes formosanus]
MNSKLVQGTCYVENASVSWTSPTYERRVPHGKLTVAQRVKLVTLYGTARFTPCVQELPYVLYLEPGKCDQHPSILPDAWRTQLLSFAVPTYSRLLQGLQTRDIGSDLIENLVDSTLPAVKKYFDPFSDSAANIVEALLRDLKNRTGAFHLESTRAFQNLRDVIKSLRPLLKDVGQDIVSCIVTEKGDILDVIKAAEAETQFCAKGLIAQIQPLAINISQRVTQIQDVAVKFSPIITDCVTSNIANPIDLPRCLSKAVGPVISELATIAVQFKNIFRKYEQENTDFQAQLQQCDTQFRDTVASVGNLVEDVRKCVTKWRSREVS